MKQKKTSSEPVAVLISDIHFTPGTLELASKSLQSARQAALSLGVPLIVAGDTLDSKAIIRGECANRLIEIFSQGGLQPRTYVMVGNHDLLNEKGSAHSLNFLNLYCDMVQSPVSVKLGSRNYWLIPYQSDQAILYGLLKELKSRGETHLIMHQGVQTAFMGHYVTDKTSLPKEDYADFRVISGHYHRAQNIKCGRPRAGGVGLFSYIGNPYTLTFAEASDGPKGYQVLHEDGLLKQVPVDLRKHVVIECVASELKPVGETLAPFDLPNKNDIIWLKVKGTRSELDALDKNALGRWLFGHSNFKLDKIALDVETAEVRPQMTEEQLFDSIIDSTAEAPEKKDNLKTLWRELLS